MAKIIIGICCVLFFSCKNGKNTPDVSHIKTDVQIDRFEKAFFAIDTNNMVPALSGLRNAYPAFYPTFMRDILGVNPIDTTTFPAIKRLIASYSSLNDSVQLQYGNVAWLQNELNYDFRFVKYYYPKYNIPRVITFIGTLDAPGIILSQQYLGIGLHQFAGKNFSAYKSPEVQQLYPAYISRRFDKEYISPNCMKAVVDDVYPDKSTGRPLIEQMVEKGKQWFLLDHFAPDAADSVKTGYTQKQLDWVTENEGNIWPVIVKENLYSIEPSIIQTYIGEAPFTQTMTEASPGNIGQWIGWRIVQKFADRNKKISVPEIMQTPAKAI
ncbi:MAG TPA: hypothetical protein VM010_03030, partial [Chitinophagaceae bacterium]|nr:hypothetical protein [Chitinophagaceae bacterium]